MTVYKPLSNLISGFDCRVMIRSGGKVNVQLYNNLVGHDEHQCAYEKMEDAPYWVQERVAVLRMLDVGGGVEGIGLRTNSNVYWIRDE
jgi:hypothetical protein